jgi:signal transduction histidine kinase
MKLNIAPKLFLGFLVIIFLNAFFVVIVSQLTSLNRITSILKRQNEAQQYLLRSSNLHDNQARSKFIYEMLQKRESVQNFQEKSALTTALLDSSIQALYTANLLDSAKTTGVSNPELQTQILKVALSVKENHMQYNDQFIRQVRLRIANINPVELAALDSSITIADENFRAGLQEADSLFTRQASARSAEIENRIASVKRLTLAMVVGISLFSVLFGFIFSRTITSALRRLRESARSIGKGEFNFDTTGYPNDEIGELAGAFHDMATDLKNAQDELVKSKRLAAIGQVVASVNHEINNPLMIISGNAQFLEMSMDENSPPDMKERIQAILDETERISKVTRKLREIKNPIVEDYTSSGEQMINLDKSST